MGEVAVGLARGEAGEDESSATSPEDNNSYDPLWDGLSYYQRSIRTVLSSVKDIYGNIFTTEETDLLNRIKGLSSDAQRLFFRLYLRKAGWFRVEKLEYRDVSDKMEAIKVLRTASLIDESPDDVAEIIGILQMEELKSLAKELHLKASGNRQQLQSVILETRNSKQKRLDFFANPRKSIADEATERIIQVGKRLMGPVIRIPDQVCEDMRRMIDLFFLDSTLEDTNLSTAILTDLNKRKYPPYSISRSRPIFASRDDWIAYDEAISYEKSLSELLQDADEGLFLDCLTATRENWQKHFPDGRKIDSYFLRRYTAGWVYTRILSSLATQLEKLKLHGEANKVLEMLLSQDLYCLGCRGHWWERLALNMANHIGDKEEALKKCLAGLADEHVRTGSRLSLKRRLAKLSKQTFTLDDPPETMTIYCDPESLPSLGRKLLYLLPGDVPGTVEDYALSYFIDQGWRGYHCESRIMRFLFTLCFWDILFGDVPDVFQTPYQSHPLDLYTDAFYQSRHERILCRLEEIEQGSAPQLLVDAYYPFYGCQAIGAMWEEYPLDGLLDVCHSMGGRALKIMLGQLAEDYSACCAGLPDLLLYKPDRSDYLLVEVKSANDRLSDAQKTWNAVMRQHGIKCVLMRVLPTCHQDKPIKKIKPQK